MSDVLAFTVNVPGKYPSVNHLRVGSHSGGKKSPEYVLLFRAVQAAAEAEIVRTGWERAEGECLATFIRFVPDRRRADALNLAKVECDALTAAGVWTDDRLANPGHVAIRHDPAGAHRVAIVVVKLHQSMHKEVAPATRMPAQGGAARSAPRRTRKLPASPGTRDAGGLPRRDHPTVTSQPWRAGDPIPAGYALLDGKPVPMSDALKMIGGKT